jgi:hypothetical protein
LTEDEEIEAIMDVFTMPGWPLILRDIKDVNESFGNIRNIQSDIEFWINKGRVEQLDFILNLEEWFRQSLDA